MKRKFEGQQQGSDPQELLQFRNNERFDSTAYSSPGICNDEVVIVENQSTIPTHYYLNVTKRIRLWNALGIIKKAVLISVSVFLLIANIRI